MVRRVQGERAMTNFARIIDSVAVDVSADPENSFHPDIAAQFVAEL